METRFQTVAELGPGDSLGVGLCAVLSGADRYFAFDAIPHARTRGNMKIFDQLLELFLGRSAVPGTAEFPEIWPPVASLDFPESILRENRISRALHPQRLAAIRRAIKSGNDEGVAIRYVAPWADSNIILPDTVDLVFSQAVLEHVEDISTTYNALFRWLRPGGVMSHEIDFKSHGVTRDWYGHWTVSAWAWQFVRGRRPYFINRLPASLHLETMNRAGFEILLEMPAHGRPAPRNALAADFRDLTDEDLSTSGLFVIARKPYQTS